YRALQRLRLEAWLTEVDPPRTPPSQVPQGGERQHSLGLEPLQQLPALVMLQLPVGPLPLQQLTDGARDLRHPQGRKLRGGLTHQLQFACGERAPAKGHDFGARGGRHACSGGAVNTRKAQCTRSRLPASATKRPSARRRRSLVYSRCAVSCPGL